MAVFYKNSGVMLKHIFLLRIISFVLLQTEFIIIVVLHKVKRGRGQCVIYKEGVKNCVMKLTYNPSKKQIYKFFCELDTDTWMNKTLT